MVATRCFLLCYISAVCVNLKIEYADISAMGPEKLNAMKLFVPKKHCSTCNQEKLCSLEASMQMRLLEAKYLYLRAFCWQCLKKLQIVLANNIRGNHSYQRLFSRTSVLWLQTLISQHVQSVLLLCVYSYNSNYELSPTNTLSVNHVMNGFSPSPPNGPIAPFITK